MRRLRPKNRRMSPYYGVVSQKISPSAAHTVFLLEKSPHSLRTRSFLPRNQPMHPAYGLFSQKISSCARQTIFSLEKSAHAP